ncbi:MAG: carbon monoxide dehydrogenase subunit G [Paracoccaceae bacterium]|nr:carbon monoxide dehydrogenase subunit G [Paracoccaceae bacterium]
MDLSDNRTINANIQTVWASLLDPAILKECVPGCQEMTGTVETGFNAVVVQKVGPVKASFKGAVTLSNLNKPDSLTISGEGTGGPAGFAKGGAKVRLEAQGKTTILHYEVQAKVGGKLAQLGSRIIDGFAKKMADQFFNNFQEAVGAVTPIVDTVSTEKGWLGRLIDRLLGR